MEYVDKKGFTISSNIATFSAWVKRWSEARMISISDAFKEQARLLGKELIDRTPPFSGKALKRMTEARGLRLMADVEDLSAKKVGERRVEIDIRKVIYGFDGAKMPEKNPKSNNPIVYKGQSSTPVQDWGVLQKCQGKEAVRIFATKTGEVYGVDMERFMPNPTVAQLDEVHERNRTKRGRVTTAGQRDRVVGRWRWMDVAVTKKKIADRYIKLKQHGVGQAKGGWADGFIALGGKVSTWIKRHVKAGSHSDNSSGGNFSFTFINHSKWAGSGDDQRIIEKSIEGREEAIKKRIEADLKRTWGEGSAVSATESIET